MVAIFGLFPLTTAQAQRGRYEGWQMAPGMMNSYRISLFEGFLMIVYWILVIIGLIFMIKWLIQMNKGREVG